MNAAVRDRGPTVVRRERTGLAHVMLGSAHGVKDLICEPIPFDVPECACQSTRHLRVTALQQPTYQISDLAQ